MCEFLSSCMCVFVTDSTSVSSLSSLNWGQMLWDVKEPTYVPCDHRHSKNTLFHLFPHSFPSFLCPLFPVSLSHFAVCMKKLWASAAMATSPNRRRGLSLQRQQVGYERRGGRKKRTERGPVANYPCADSLFKKAYLFQSRKLHSRSQSVIWMHETFSFPCLDVYNVTEHNTSLVSV